VPGQPVPGAHTQQIFIPNALVGASEYRLSRRGKGAKLIHQSSERQEPRSMRFARNHSARSEWRIRGHRPNLVSPPIPRNGS
jgi:hypothetical protein